ncbi:von Willebrand factor type A domain protein [Planctomycetes bacterium CA13]|uniref:von Willebrand factor type A domain protein n=1 Tax=Novipirellula herctigrandis TaxID=2527986 RepID=A0A5C5Z220_9BACT|nr:von Willebrand factor type A domain protein [Planctomycetes bacterium CA13]
MKPIYTFERPAKANNRRGAMLVLIVFMMIGFMIAVTFSVDIAQMHLSRTELRSATDAASKAAALELSITQDRDLAVVRGQEIALMNTVNSEPLIIEAGEFEFGRSEESSSGKFEFVSNQVPMNSVKVNGKRTTDSNAGAVPLFFGNFVGVEYFEPQTQATATYIERDIVLVVDRSGSMAGYKIGELRAAIDIFIATLNDTSVEEKVGLASYNDQASEDVQLTDDLAQVSSAMSAMAVGGWTSISRGMDAGHAIMSNSRDSQFVERTMIVMTDGQHNRGPEPSTSAVRLAADGVTIHTITFGTGADIARMGEVATIGGGKHYHAASGEELRRIYREIALTLSTMLTQ